MKKKKIIVFLITFVMVLAVLSSTIFALHPGEVLIDDDIEGTEELQNFGNRALGIIQTIGVVSSVIILMVCGFKYMMGSVEEKAGYKKALVPYVVGAVLLFTVPTAANVVYEFSGGSQTGQTSITLPFCPNGTRMTATRREWKDSITGETKSKIEYMCTKNGTCGCPSIVLGEIAEACPTHKIKLTGANNNFCESCKKTYK